MMQVVSRVRDAEKLHAAAPVFLRRGLLRRGYIFSMTEIPQGKNPTREAGVINHLFTKTVSNRQHALRRRVSSAAGAAAAVRNFS
jgi:hypothetical protein